MTPTEQDNELREKIAYYCEENDQASLLDFITQYGDTRERLGRIDELENIAWVGPVKHVHERLAELKEEV